MSKNTHHCCIVFSRNWVSAYDKMEEIVVEKGNPENVIKTITRNTLRYTFDDEVWIWVNTSYNNKGKRAYKAYIDMDCTIRDLEYIIKPICYTYCKECRYY